MDASEFKAIDTGPVRATMCDCQRQKNNRENKNITVPIRQRAT